MIDWLERYAADLGLNIWTGTEFSSLRRDEADGH
jgi:putative flavoprotein involved in K+ transport